MADRERLLALARREAEALAERPGTRGVFLYGSLTGDPADLTDHSDVDLGLVVDDAALPAHFAEHRLVGDIKTDVTLLAASVLRRWAETPPPSLWGDHWVHSLFLRGLCRGREDALLVDPTGQLATVAATLPPLRTLAAHDTRAWLTGFRRERLEPAEACQALGDDEPVRELLTPDWLRRGACYLVDAKRIDEATLRLGLPALAPLFAEWEALLAPPAETIRACCTAREALGEHTLAALHAPVAQALRHQGIAEPGALELCGEWPVFWGGNRLQSLARIDYDAATTAYWSRRAWETETPRAALETLWPFAPEAVRARADGLRDALGAQGLSVGATTDAFLAGAVLPTLEARIAAADAEAADATPRPDPRRLLSLARQALDLLESAL